jgi:hypothetical protein
VRTLVLTLALVPLLGACGPLRGLVGRRPVAPVVAGPAPQPERPPSRPTAARHLGCLAHPSIDVWERRLRTERRFLAATVQGRQRGGRYLDRIREIVDEAGLPSSLALLPVVESGFRPAARGPRGSVGLWQFQKATARRFGLVVSATRDDRLHPERATRAAVRYLTILYGRYRDWPLALAAYNAGEGRVDRALRRRPGATFWELAGSHGLPPISRHYVPRFLAVVRVLEDVRGCDVKVAEGDPLTRRRAGVPAGV